MNSKTLNFLNNAVKITYSSDSNFKVHLKTKRAVPAAWVFDFSNNGTKLISSDHCWQWMSTRHPHTDINFSWKKFKGEMETLHNSFGHRFIEELPPWLLRLYKWKWIKNCQAKSNFKTVTFQTGDAMSLTYEDNSKDIGTMALVLFFFTRSSSWNG